MRAGEQIVRVEVGPARGEGRPKPIQAESGVVRIAPARRKRKEIGSVGRAVASHQRPA